MTSKTKQKLFDYLSKELNTIPLETNLLEIEKIILSDEEHFYEKNYSKLGELTFKGLIQIFGK